MKRIGIVEDDRRLGTELETFLNHNGYQAELLEESEYTPQKILEKNFHLLLLDIGLPKTDGLFLCREIRKSSPLPMMMITSRNTEMMELMSISNGADDFIAKPFNVQILLARMERLLSRVYQENEEKAWMQFGDLTFDILKGTISSGGQSIELTKNEIKILLCLGKNVNKIVSRDELINMLWDSEMFVDDNTLTVNMTRLRQKFKALGKENFIQTKRGLGYLLCDS